MPLSAKVFFALTLAGLLTAGPVQAANPYAIESGLEGLDEGDSSIKALRVPINITLRNWSENPYGLRLRLAATFATTDFDKLLDGTFQVARVSSFVPGLEFVIPLGENSLLMPHVDLGAGFQSQANRSALLATLGLRTQFVVAGRHYFAGFEPGFQVNNISPDDSDARIFFHPNVTVSGRRVLGFTTSGHQPDAGIFIEAGYDFNALEYTSVRAVSGDSNTQWEVGAGFGYSQSKPKVGPFSFPRIRIGYRFGELEGWRIRIGGDWLNSVVGLDHPDNRLD